MADEEQRLTRPQRVSRLTKRARDGQASGRAPTQDERSVRMFEADAVITTLHELCLIPASSRPDRRSIALAVAALRNELQGSATEQGQFYGLQVNTIRNVMTDWVEDVDARLQQALRYRALPADERATFSVSRPSEAELALRESNKRQRAENGAFAQPGCVPPHDLYADADTQAMAYRALAPDERTNAKKQPSPARGSSHAPDHCAVGVLMHPPVTYVGAPACPLARRHPAHARPALSLPLSVFAAALGLRVATVCTLCVQYCGDCLHRCSVTQSHYPWERKRAVSLG